MPFQPFPVPGRAHGTSHRYGVDNTNQAMLVSRLYRKQWAGDEFTVTVTLLDDLREGGFKVKWDYGVVGTLPKQVRAQYPELSRILASSLNPEVTAHIFRKQEALGIEVELPDPGLLLPANTWPTSPWMLMPYGQPIEIDISASSSSVTDNLQAMNHRQFLVRLALTDDNCVAVLFNGPDLEDSVVGVLHEPYYTELKDAINHFEILGLIPVARAYFWDGVATVEPIRTADLTEEQLEPPISPMRDLIAEAPAPAQHPEVEEAEEITQLTQGGSIVTDNGNGEWSLSMPSETFPAVTPERMAAYEASINAQEPPTQVFSTVSEQKPEVGVDPEKLEERRHVEEAIRDMPETPLWPVPPLSEEGPAYRRHTNRQRPRPVGTPRRNPQVSPIPTPAPDRDPEPAPSRADSLQPDYSPADNGFEKTDEDVLFPEFDPDFGYDGYEDDELRQPNYLRILTWVLLLVAIGLLVILFLLI